jgi:hypothetical protein
MTDGFARIAPSWRARALPLAPCAVLALGVTANRLGERLLRLAPERLASLKAVASARALLVLAASEELPWRDGVRYFARDPAAPRLLLPSALEPDLPLALFERGVERLVGREAFARGAPWLVCRDSSLILATAAARRIDRARLETWLARDAQGSGAES